MQISPIVSGSASLGGSLAWMHFAVHATGVYLCDALEQHRLTTVCTCAQIYPITAPSRWMSISHNVLRASCRACCRGWWWLASASVGLTLALWLAAPYSWPFWESLHSHLLRTQGTEEQDLLLIGSRVQPGNPFSMDIGIGFGPDNTGMVVNDPIWR